MPSHNRLCKLISSGMSARLFAKDKSTSNASSAADSHKPSRADSFTHASERPFSLHSLKSFIYLYSKKKHMQKANAVEIFTSL